MLSPARRPSGCARAVHRREGLRRRRRREPHRRIGRPRALHDRADPGDRAPHDAGPERSGRARQPGDRSGRALRARRRRRVHAAARLGADRRRSRLGLRDLIVPEGPVAPIRVGPDVRERVRWRDVDIMGVVHYANYLRFMEAAESEFFRALGFPYDVIADELGVWIARVHLECDYRAPAKLDDEITCRAELRKLGGSSMTFAFPVDRADGVRLIDGTLVLAALDRTTLRAARIPPPLATALRAP